MDSRREAFKAKVRELRSEFENALAEFPTDKEERIRHLADFMEAQDAELHHAITNDEFMNSLSELMKARGTKIKQKYGAGYKAFVELEEAYGQKKARERQKKAEEESMKAREKTKRAEEASMLPREAEIKQRCGLLRELEAEIAHRFAFIKEREGLMKAKEELKEEFREFIKAREELKEELREIEQRYGFRYSLNTEFEKAYGVIYSQDPKLYDAISVIDSRDSELYDAISVSNLLDTDIRKMGENEKKRAHEDGQTGGSESKKSRNEQDPESSEI